MNISVAIMAHPQRRTQAMALLDMLRDMPFDDVAVVFDTNDDEWTTGKRCLSIPNLESEWHVVLQDDAIIHPHFYHNLVRALMAVPEYSLVSLYTGTVRPEQERVQSGLRIAAELGASWLTSNSLYWGVGVAIPREDMIALVQLVEDSILPYDRRLGSYFNYLKRPIYYTVPSIVDHDYKLPSLLGNDRVSEVRHAHNYEPVLTYFNSDVVRLV